MYNRKYGARYTFRCALPTRTILFAISMWVAPLIFTYVSCKFHFKLSTEQMSTTKFQFEVRWAPELAELFLGNIWFFKLLCELITLHWHNTPMYKNVRILKQRISELRQSWDHYRSHINWSSLDGLFDYLLLFLYWSAFRWKCVPVQARAFAFRLAVWMFHSTI